MLHHPSNGRNPAIFQSLFGDRVRRLVKVSTTMIQLDANSFLHQKPFLLMCDRHCLMWDCTAFYLVMHHVFKKMNTVPKWAIDVFYVTHCGLAVLLNSIKL